ncbi:hypothetical protein [Schleiferia thermophila]|uniref:M61 family metallopeptidase n=1 Tax=Schleiferia thermophila TaxID=884107 RepID=UPI003EEFD041
MKNKFKLLLGFFLLVVVGFAQQRPVANRAQNAASKRVLAGYEVTLNLNEARDGLIPVEMKTPMVEGDTAVFGMPAIVPGTYKIYDFGRFIFDLQAFDADGMPLYVQKHGLNQWKIYPGRKLATVRYKAKETYSDESDRRIFEPAGSDYQDSVFLMNLFTSVGFLVGQEQRPYRLVVERPKWLYGVTSLTVVSRGEEKDEFRGRNYFEIHDNPILYSRPDTASLQVKNTRVMVGVYSPNRVITAQKSLEQMQDIFEAAALYLGGKLPTELYTVLLYLADPEEMRGSGFGALEHETSTVLYMPEYDGDEFFQYMNDIVAHEFLHIVTPLTLRSHYVHHFDFNTPRMSKHLWLYEGVTEYTSHLIQVRAGLINVDEFLNRMREKIVAMVNFNAFVPMTTSSKYALDIYQDEYLNVYNKGAVLGMCIDLNLRALSNGEMGLGDVIRKLQNVYGRDTFFVDEDFFEIFTSHSHPAMKEFFARYVESAEPLPLEDLLGKAGVRYKPVFTRKFPSFGGIRIAYNEDRKAIYVSDVSDLDAFGKEMGLKEGDEIVTIKGMPFSLETFESTVANYFQTTKEGDVVEFEINRPQKKNKYKRMKLKGKAIMVNVEQEHLLELDENTSEKNIALRLKWLNQ